MFTYRTRNFSYKFFLLKNKYIITLSLIDFSNKYFFICNIFDNILKRMKEIVHNERYIYQITTSNPQKILDDIDIHINYPEKLKIAKKLFFFK